MSLRVLVRASVVASLVAVASPAAADEEADKNAAKELLDIAVEQAKEGDNPAALSSFRASYAKFPDPLVLYFIGKMCVRTSDDPCAVRAFEQYLSDSGDDVPAKRRKQVEAELKKLEKTVGRVVIQSNVGGAEVSLDDKPIGKTPFAAPLAVSAGSHEISLSWNGETVEKSFDVAAGKIETVTLDAKDPDASSEAEAEEADAEEAPRRSDAVAGSEGKKFPILPWAITGALAAGTALTGVLAAGAYGDFKDKREQFPISRDELDDAQGKARDLLLLTGALGAGTLVSLGIASYVTFFSGSSSGPPSKVRVGLVFGPTAVGISGVMP